MSAAPTTAAELRAWLLSGDELAVLDAREQGQFATDHLFWASCVPLSSLERRVAALVPRRDCPVVWVDADGAEDGLAARAARRLGELGWTNVSTLAGGMPAWPGEHYSGVNVASKAFGEWVERLEHTPHLSAVELARRQAQGERIVIVDSRPMREFHRMSIPGGIDCPGAELVYRIHDLAPDPDTTIVVNCAGRTRSIIGAQSLRNAGIANPVLALEGGTMGWELAGLTLDHGQTAHAAPPSAPSLAVAMEAAGRVARRFGVPTLDLATLQGWLADTTRTTFVLDVRSAEEYDAGHSPGARHAAGGQIVQATDEYVGVLGARVVLVDDASLVRATMTASWLAQLGRYQVAVVRLDDAVKAGPAPSNPAIPSSTVGVPTIEAAALAARLEGVHVIDLADSLRYRRGHIPGAWWAVRARFDKLADIGAPVVLVSPDDELARWAWPDAEGRWPGTTVLAGGTAAWVAGGHGLEAGMTRPTTDTDDVWYKPYDAQDETVARQHMRDYLEWEVELLNQIDGDALVAFRAFPA